MPDIDTSGNGKRRKRRKLSVLLVEDDDADKELILRLLEKSVRFECDVRHVRKMAAAIDAVNKADFNIVILDLKLLDSDPDDTIKRLALIPYRTPTIIVSGSLTDDENSRAIEMGADACLDKNQMSVFRLCDTIRDAIGRRAQKLERMNIPLQLRELKQLIEDTRD